MNDSPQYKSGRIAFPIPMHIKPSHDQMVSVLEALHRLYSAKALQDFPRIMMTVAGELVPCTNVSFDTIDLTTGEVTNVFDRPIAIPHQEFMSRWKVYCHHHPGIAFLENGGAASVFAITDFMPRRSLRKTAFFREIAVPVGALYQIGVIFPASHHVVLMALNRDREFGVKERELIQLLHPHFVQAFRNAELFSSPQKASEPDFQTWRRHGLTYRECEVLRWLMEGKRNSEIAIILGIQSRTIGKHLEGIFSKLGVETRAAAAAEARHLLADE